MKKIILLICLLLSNSAFALSEKDVPTWKDIAPVQYSENLEYIKDETIHGTKPALNIFYGITVVGLPTAIYSYNKHKKIETNNYWYQRKLDFNKELNLCNAMKNNDNKMSCYLAVRHNEQMKTYQRESLILIQEQISASRAAARGYNSLYYRNRMRMQSTLDGLFYGY